MQAVHENLSRSAVSETLKEPVWHQQPIFSQSHWDHIFDVNISQNSCPVQYVHDLMPAM